MITRFTLSNFKSLVDFSLPPRGEGRLCPVVFLIGPNAAGKSTILQSIGLLGRLIKGDITGWLRERDWTVKELRSQFLRSVSCSFFLELELANGVFQWSGRFNYARLRCISEGVTLDDRPLLESEKGHCRIGGNVYSTDVLEYEGSILSALRDERLPDDLRAFKQFVSEVSLLDQLTPAGLRRRSRTAPDIGVGGEGLSGFLYSLTDEILDLIGNDYQLFFPDVGFTVHPLRSGWKHLDIFEDRYLRGLSVPAKHSSDGRLRILAIIAQTYSNRSIILLDEIENGIFPEITEKLVDYLQERANLTKKQFWVTTHNPLVLNYLTDDVARESVYLAQRDENGHTVAIQYFEQDVTARKLEFMGPGEVFVDTPVSAL